MYQLFRIIFSSSDHNSIWIRIKLKPKQVRSLRIIPSIEKSKLEPLVSDLVGTISSTVKKKGLANVSFIDLDDHCQHRPQGIVNYFCLFIHMFDNMFLACFYVFCLKIINKNNLQKCRVTTRMSKIISSWPSFHMSWFIFYKLWYGTKSQSSQYLKTTRWHRTRWQFRIVLDVD